MRLGVAALGLVLVACNGSDDAAPTTTGAPATTRATTTTVDPTAEPACAGTTATAQEPATPAIAGIPELSQLSAVLEESEFGQLLAGDGPFTVLAPIDSAFDADPAITDRQQLAAVVALHVIDEQGLTAAELAQAGTVTAAGGELSFTTEGETVRVNGEASIVCADVRVANGTIHLVDAVLTPPIAEETVGGTQLYSVDLATGATTALGAIGSELGVIGLTFAPDGGHVYGLTDAGELLTFAVDDPATVTAVPITGVADGSTLIALSTGNGGIYAISDASVLYTIDPATGTAEEVGDGINPPIADPGVGFAIQPRTLNGSVSVATGENLPIDLATGTVRIDPATEQPVVGGAFTRTGGPPPRLVALAWEYGPTDAVTLYGIDSAAGALVLVESPDEGVVRTIGPLGVTLTDGASFDVLEPGTGLLAVPG